MGNHGTMIERTRQWARLAKRDVHAIHRAARDPRVLWYPKALAFCVAGYALSPIDLIPDFVPVLGYMDDVLIVPRFTTLQVHQQRLRFPEDVLSHTPPCEQM